MFDENKAIAEDTEQTVSAPAEPTTEPTGANEVVNIPVTGSPTPQETQELQGANNAPAAVSGVEAETGSAPPTTDVDANKTPIPDWIVDELYKRIVMPLEERVKQLESQLAKHGMEPRERDV